MRKNLSWTCFAACLVILSALPVLAQNDSFSTVGDSFSSGGDSFSSAGVLEGDASQPKLRLNFAMHVLEPELSELAKISGLREVTLSLSGLEGDPTGDEFSGYGRAYMEAVERYLKNGSGGAELENNCPISDVFDSGYGLPHKGVMTYFDNDARGALLVGHSFPVEQQWTLYFAGKTKNPPFRTQFPEAPHLIGVIGGARNEFPEISADHGDAFSSGALFVPSRRRYRPGSRRSHARVGSRTAWQAAPHSARTQIVSSGAQSATAGLLGEPHWTNSNPLRVYISGVVAGARGGLVSQEIKSALRQWREASNGKIRYVLTDRYVDADILFVCARTLDNEWAENIISYHNSMYDRVHVNLLEETLYKLDPKRVRAVCLHEVGHAFGIRDHSRDNKDAMSLAATDDFHPILALTNNDKKLIAKLYP